MNRTLKLSKSVGVQGDSFHKYQEPLKLLLAITPLFKLFLAMDNKAVEVKVEGQENTTISPSRWRP